MRQAATLVLSALVFAGCSSGGSSTPSASAPPTAATAPPTALPVAPASPSTTGPEASPTAAGLNCPNPEVGMGNSCLGQIEAGTYTTQLFSPTLTYTVPAGWGNLEDMAGNFLLLPPGATLRGVNPGTSDYLGVYTSVVAAGACTEQPRRGVPETFDGLVGWLKADPAIALANIHDVTVGGLNGVVMDISLKDPRGDGCAEGVWGDVYVGKNPSSLVHAVAEDYPLRVYLLHNGDRTLAIELADAKGGSDYPDWFAAATPIVESFVFSPD